MKLRHALFAVDAKFKKKKKYADDESDLDDDAIDPKGACLAKCKTVRMAADEMEFWDYGKQYPESRKITYALASFVFVDM